MAHQTHNIHWNALTSCLKVHAPERPTRERPINLYFRFEDNQDKNISHFVTSFLNNIKEHTACERRKYPATFEIPKEDDLILGDDTTQKITPLVHKWRQAYTWDLASESDNKKTPSLRKLCTHDNEEGFGCGCVIPLREMKAAAFLRQHYPNDCYQFFKKNTEAFYNIEVVKTLLLYGEMEPILRVCAHPNADIGDWENQCECYCMDHDAGWDTVYEAAMNAYLTLNILYSFPELWDPASSSSRPTDYRSTKLYQVMLRYCTWSGCSSEVAKYPHRAFFGIGDNQFHSWPCMDSAFELKYRPPGSSDDYRRFAKSQFPYGQAPFDEFLNAESNSTGYLPDGAAVAVVRDILYRKRLPLELVNDVMERADYTVKRRLVYPHDPFHAGNKEELQKHLKYCWRLIINCNMMADALGMKIGWEGLIYRILSWQISASGGRMIGRPDIT